MKYILKTFNQIKIMVESTISALEAGNKKTGEDIMRLKNSFSIMMEEKKRDKATIETLTN